MLQNPQLHRGALAAAAVLGLGATLLAAQPANAAKRDGCGEVYHHSYITGDSFANVCGKIDTPGYYTGPVMRVRLFQRQGKTVDGALHIGPYVIRVAPLKKGHGEWVNLPHVYNMKPGDNPVFSLWEKPNHAKKKHIVFDLATWT